MPAAAPVVTAMPMSRAVLLGLVQGVAETVPVSSSAQLTLLPVALGWPDAWPQGRTTLAAALHAGSCAGLLFAARADVRALLTTSSGRRTAALVAAATVPASVAGALLADPVEQRLGRPGPTAALLAAGGVLLWLADRRPQRHRQVGAPYAGAAALAQVLALAPGVSRSGATLTALRGCAVARPAAHRFSLLMSLPVTGGAAVFGLARAVRRDRSGASAPAGAGTPGTPWGPLAVAVPVAAISAALTHRLLSARPDRSATGAALYRVALAGVVGARLRRTGREGLL